MSEGAYITIYLNTATVGVFPLRKLLTKFSVLFIIFQAPWKRNYLKKNQTTYQCALFKKKKTRFFFGHQKKTPCISKCTYKLSHTLPDGFTPKINFPSSKQNKITKIDPKMLKQYCNSKIFLTFAHKQIEPFNQI